MKGSIKTLVLGGNCAEAAEAIDWRLDGHPTTSDVIASLDPRSIAAAEIYTNRLRTPTEFMGRLKKGCAVVIWTKLGFGR
jgi:hypothetical protein